ncbi:ATP-grasp domain-containing protein [Miniphocaeibacter massiliensis]|uniref:carboxylate--amine ligase n=1 Tax=Miniphocaeibacter massiliensis TaxID=2041841 RepID=UPI000C073FB9|nr:ATP-grasp domain-containing protein [Miniphocaeibacter massiliensis]
MKEDFLPIILGTDINAYGVARSFHQAYGINSVTLGKMPLPFTQNSKIVDVKTFEGFDTQDVFLEKMLEVGKKYSEQGKKLILISCSDGYTSLITNNKEALEEYFLFNYVSLEMQQQLENKKDFYEICEKYGLDYPNTYVISKDMRDNYEIPFEFPLAVKPNDSIEFLHLDFEGKKKAYKANNKEEYEKIIKDVYDAGYTGELIVQDFIPGDHSTMAVLNAYVDTKGRVKMMCFGKCLLDECQPQGIGNYNALVTQDNPEIYKMAKKFLEDINYRGFANFDFKYDRRDGKHKVFEINIRQGRSSFYMTTGGCNFVEFLVDDLIYGKDEPTYYHKREKLWLYADPSVLKKYANKDDAEYAKKLIKKGYEFTQWYKEDRNLKRFLLYMRRRLGTIKYYPKLQPSRQED